MLTFFLLQSAFGNVIVRIVPNVFTVPFRFIHLFLEKDRNGNNTGDDRGPLNYIEQTFHTATREFNG